MCSNPNRLKPYCWQIRVICLAVGLLGFLSPCFCEELTTPPVSAMMMNSTEERFEQSIRNEALSEGYNICQTASSSHDDRLALAVAAQAVTVGADPDIARFLPTVPIALADGRVNGNISPNATNMSYNGERTRLTVDFGLGYYKYGIENGGVAGRLGVSMLPNDFMAIGAIATIYEQRRDLILNAILQIPQSGLRLSAAGGYLWGQQAFDFPSGSADIGLEQYSWLLSASWVPYKGKEGGWLHSVGASVWGANANQQSELEPLSFVTQTGADYLVWSDPRTLSEGRLFGLSADIQAALAVNLVAKGSLGYEELYFPFADGTKEINETLYANIGFNWELMEQFIVNAAWKGGASENRYSLKLSSGQWDLDGWYSQGRNSVEDDKGVMLRWNLTIPYGGPKQPLSKRMRPSRASNPSELLAAAQQRPSQLPSAFLAKVDLTAVKEAASIGKMGLTEDIKVDQHGNIILTVGEGVPVITGMSRNGTTYAFGDAIATKGTKVVIRTLSLPEGVANWEIQVTDGIATRYIVTFETE